MTLIKSEGKSFDQPHDYSSLSIRRIILWQEHIPLLKGLTRWTLLGRD